MSPQPPAGAWAVAAEAAALVAAEPHSAAAEACEPKMLSATIGLICEGAAEAVELAAKVGLAHIATATPITVIFLDTPPSIVQLPHQEADP